MDARPTVEACGAAPKLFYVALPRFLARTIEHCESGYTIGNIYLIVRTQKRQADLAWRFVMRISVAGGQGLEPQLPDPESGVLPLNYPPLN